MVKTKQYNFLFTQSTELLNFLEDFKKNKQPNFDIINFLKNIEEAKRIEHHCIWRIKQGLPLFYDTWSHITYNYPNKFTWNPEIINYENTIIPDFNKDIEGEIVSNFYDSKYLEFYHVVIFTLELGKRITYVQWNYFYHASMMALYPDYVKDYYKNFKI